MQVTGFGTGTWAGIRLVQLYRSLDTNQDIGFDGNLDIGTLTWIPTGFWTGFWTGLWKGFRAGCRTKVYNAGEGMREDKERRQ